MIVEHQYKKRLEHEGFICPWLHRCHDGIYDLSSRIDAGSTSTLPSHNILVANPKERRRLRYICSSQLQDGTPYGHDPRAQQTKDKILPCRFLASSMPAPQCFA
eukprot:2337878-Amphidinium_carterae.1